MFQNCPSGGVLSPPPPRQGKKTPSSLTDVSKESCSNNRKMIGSHRKGAQRREASSESSPEKVRRLQRERMLPCSHIQLTPRRAAVGTHELIFPTRPRLFKSFKNDTVCFCFLRRALQFTTALFFLRLLRPLCGRHGVGTGDPHTCP